MDIEEKAKEIYRAMANKKVVRVLWADGWYNLHSLYTLNGVLYTVINNYIIPDYYQIEEDSRQEYSLSGWRVEAIKAALDNNKKVRVWHNNVMYQAAGYEVGSFTKILVRRAVVAEVYKIYKCSEHPLCKNGHCHEAGCEHYEEECNDALKQMDFDRSLEIESERRSEEILYGYELPR